jgi:hypothetical protein
MKTYSFQQFLKEYPNDDVCLDKIFSNYYGELKSCPVCGVIGSKFYRLKGLKAYSCEFCRYQIYPLVYKFTRSAALYLRGKHCRLYFVLLDVRTYIVLNYTNLLNVFDTVLSGDNLQLQLSLDQLPQ